MVRERPVPESVKMLSRAFGLNHLNLQRRYEFNPYKIETKI
jgi:hypothetical protein